MSRERSSAAVVTLVVGAAIVVLAAPRAPARPSAESNVAALPADSVRALVTRLIPAVEALRGHAFRAAVPVEVEDDAVAAEYFTDRLDRFLPPERRRAWEHVHAAFGFIDRDTDVERVLLDVLAEQAGGYYDPQRESFVLLGDMPAAALSALAVHELTHALDDQYYDLDSLLAATADDDDRGAALGAVIEGSGVDVMTSWMIEALASGELEAEALTALAAGEAGKAERLRAAPDFVVRSLLASYVAGHAFLRHPGSESMAAQIDRAFAALPVSTEQVLHPAKYWDPDSLDVPSPMPGAEFDAGLGGAYTLLGSGAFGELELASLTGDQLDLGAFGIPDGAAFTNAAASGWDGDRWWVWAQGKRLVAVMASRWDSVRDAQEFETQARWPADVHVVRRGELVVAVHGLKDPEAARVAEACFAELGKLGAR